MKPAAWFWWALALVAVFAGLSPRAADASSEEMPTATKTKKPAARPVPSPARKAAAKPVRNRAAPLPYGIAPRSLPAGVAVAGDAAARAEFGKHADWRAVSAAYGARSL